ncbi:hypothetical protein PDESU_01057 [Pontiella desulfatans]|uniref:Uncharacterized protein n=1 Tax=Pontiella desulfatans TaxID=2750659 RepID=A0A6C2TYH2_PONDE|nr:hypothetical protein [Pontiella desulfatans]VGO12504.1 hypothetical protein PDESU_01057 [Pontiella desulfatans]
MKKTFTLILAAVLCGAALAYPPEAGSDAEKESKKGWAIVPDPDLPNVLILGDQTALKRGVQLKGNDGAAGI